MTEEATCAPRVYEAINAVMAELAREGIAKTRKNQQQGFYFRGIDDVYNLLSRSLSNNGLVMLPRLISHTHQERTARGGGAVNYTIVEVEFDLVSSRDGSKHTIRTIGEAMDSVDKSSNKAMSAAFKYAAFQAFCIPTEGDNDADATTHDLAPPAPADQDEDERFYAQHIKRVNGKLTGLTGPHQVMSHLKSRIRELGRHIASAVTIADLSTYLEEYAEDIAQVDRDIPGWGIGAKITARRREIEKLAAARDEFGQDPGDDPLAGVDLVRLAERLVGAQAAFREGVRGCESNRAVNAYLRTHWKEIEAQSKPEEVAALKAFTEQHREALRHVETLAA